MAVNPMDMVKIGGRLKIFNSQHPRVGSFMREVSTKAIEPGAVIEMKVTSVEGKEYVCNIKVTPEDLETVQMIRNMQS